MVLRSIVYAVLFVVCAVVCARARGRSVRQWTLLVASCVLYCSWGTWFAAVLAASVVINFFFGQWLRKGESRAVLALGIFANLVLLAAFKYLPEAASALPFAGLQPFARLVLPLGLSFWTFQAMSYLFDLYRGEELEPTFVEFALYMAFFPVTISGPVCRLPDMLPQFRRDERTATCEIRSGLARMATGVLMMQVAQLLGQGILAGGGVNQGFDAAKAWNASDVWCLAFGYGLQLFFDFAGYSHIAIGAAQTLGITVPENFARPFASTTPSIFWTRWHMSLSFWIRDYVFLPLAMLRREMWWRNFALLLSMVIFGLWHKASWLFLIWGAYHGILLVLHRQLQAVERKFNWDVEAPLWTLFSRVATIGLISLGWIFFRANSLDQARAMLSALVAPSTYGTHLLSGSLYALVFATVLAYALVLHFADAGKGDAGANAFQRSRWYWLPPLYILVLVLVLLVNHSHIENGAQFMYRGF